MADPNAGYVIPNPTGVEPAPVDIKPVEKDWWQKAVDDAPGTIGSAVISAMFPPLGMLNLAAQGVNFLTGEKTVPTIPGIINDAVRGTSTAAPSTAPTAEEYYKYGAAGDGSPDTDPMKMYKELYGGGSDKKLLGIESLDKSPLLPKIDPSVPTAPLFDYNYSNFGITGAPTAEYKYSNFGI